MYFILLFSYFHAVFADIVLTTTYGPVRGVTSLVDDVAAFLGIPYAEPPVGERRFALPIPKEKWSEMYDASKLPPPCAQVFTEPYYFMPDISNMSEDCLYLNIWVPKPKSSKKVSRRRRPIVVFFHSGLFLFGSASMKVHDGSKLASRGDMIVVSVNYRLGAFGFLWGFTNDAPGSMGIHDQIMAVRWIKENAEYIGGDPGNIILMGSSAGALCTVAFILSPLTQNLFRRAIIQSGSALMPTLHDNNTRLAENSEAIAGIAGCKSGTMTLRSNPDAVIECLKRKPVDTILDAEKNLMQVHPAILFPRVYDEILPESPVNLLRGGKFKKDIDVLMGVTSDEGTMMITYAIPHFFDFYGKNKIDLTSARRARNFIQVGILFSKITNFTRIADDYINKGKSMNLTDYTKLVATVVGDISVTCPVVFTANFLSLTGIPVYFYKFDFRSASTPLAEWMGTTHLDEIQYIFGNPYHENLTSEETELSHHMMDRWSAFARTGNPDVRGHVHWPQYSYHSPLYLNFGQEAESIQLHPSETCEFVKKPFKAEIDEHLIQYLQNSTLKKSTGNVSRKGA